MQRNSLHDFIFFGTAFRYLMDLHYPIRYSFDGGPRENIEMVLHFFNSNNMRVSNNASNELRAFRTEADKKATGAEYELMQADVEKLRDIMAGLRSTVLAESHEVKAFFPSEKRYNIDLLFEDIAAVFGREIFEKLPVNARQDFAEAGKCIVLERGTAAAYHLMRGSECALKQLYFSVIKRNRLDKPMWAGMVDQLGQKKARNDALRGTLDGFRRGFRNPVAHPDHFYTTDDAQDLLGTTTQLISLIVKHPKYVPAREQI